MLILGLKGLKKTIKKLRERQTLSQIRQEMMQQQKKTTNTYSDDFFEVEINEEDLYNTPEERNGSATSPTHLDEEIFSFEEREKKEEKPLR